VSDIAWFALQRAQLAEAERDAALKERDEARVILGVAQRSETTALERALAAEDQADDLRRRLSESEAGAAQLREALDGVVACCNTGGATIAEHRAAHDAAAAALSSTAGRAYGERVKKLEALADRPPCSRRGRAREGGGMSPDVREGQVWQSTAARDQRRGRRVRVVGVEERRVVVRNIATDRLSYVSRRLFPVMFEPVPDVVPPAPSYSPEDVKMLVEAARRFSAMAGVRRAHSLACKCNGVDFDGLSCGQRHSALARALEPFGDQEKQRGEG